jgi:hypothetical protein
MLTQVNAMFVPPQLDELDATAFDPTTSAPEAIRALGLDGVDYVGAYVRAMPSALVHTVLAAIYAALNTQPRSTVTVAWSEASHYGVTVSEVSAPPPGERGAVTILLTGPLTPS